MWHVYILACRDGSLYTGVTNNVAERLKAHTKGVGGKYTRSHTPVKLVHSERYRTHGDALRREMEIKSWKREKKMDLIAFGNRARTTTHA